MVRGGFSGPVRQADEGDSSRCQTKKSSGADREETQRIGENNNRRIKKGCL